MLKSDVSKFEGPSWDAPRCVALYNLGRLDDSGKDYLGVVWISGSMWSGYHIYRYDNGWNEVIEPFSIYGFENIENRVCKSRIPGYVTIYENDPSDFSISRREVRLSH